MGTKPTLAAQLADTAAELESLRSTVTALAEAQDGDSAAHNRLVDTVHAIADYVGWSPEMLKARDAQNQAQAAQAASAGKSPIEQTLDRILGEDVDGTRRVVAAEDRTEDRRVLADANCFLLLAGLLELEPFPDAGEGYYRFVLSAHPVKPTKPLEQLFPTPATSDEEAQQRVRALRQVVDRLGAHYERKGSQFSEPTA